MKPYLELNLNLKFNWIRISHPQVSIPCGHFLALASLWEKLELQMKLALELKLVLTFG